MRSLAIILICVAAAVGYGIVHDQITVRLCLEYFTIGHPRVFGDLTDPTLLGLGWGVIATWWVGLPLGIGLALAARAGRRPKREVRDLLRPIGKLLTVMALSALSMGFLGWLLASLGWIRLTGSLASEVPTSQQVAFIADMWAHSASYVVGIVGGVEVIIRQWRGRKTQIVLS